MGAGHCLDRRRIQRDVVVLASSDAIDEQRGYNQQVKNNDDNQSYHRPNSS
jgi:hypothetical protein